MTPLIASLGAVVVNVAIKIMLMDTYGVVGLALGTAIGIWVNLVLLVILATRRRWMAPSAQLGRILAAIFGATILLAVYSRFAPAPLALFARDFPRWHAEILLLAVGTGGAVVYGIGLVAGLRIAGVKLARS